MKTVEAEYISMLGKHIHALDPKVPFISSVINTTISEPGELGSSYWARNLVSPVLFSGAVKTVLDIIPTKKVFLEIGPHSALAGPIRQIFRHHSATDEYLSTIKRGQDGHVEVLKAVGELWLLNHEVDFASINSGGDFLTDLPLYPWHYEEPLWYESRLSREWRFRKYPHHDLLGSRVLESTDHNPSWRNIIRLDEIRWIKEHEVAGEIVLPGVAYICMAAEAIRQITGSTDYTARKIHIKAALIMHQGQDVEAITHLQRSRLTSSLDSSWFDFSVFSMNNGTWIQHIFGQIRAGSEHERPPVELKHLPRQSSRRGWYRKMQQMGFEYGPRFKGMMTMSSHPTMKSAVATVKNDIQPGESTYAVHPVSFDCLLQLLVPAACNGLTRRFQSSGMPTYIEEIYVRAPSGEMTIRANADFPPKGLISGDVIAVSDGVTVIDLKGLQMSNIGGSEDTSSQFRDLHAATELEWKPDLNHMDSSELFHIKANRREIHAKLDKFSALCMLETHERLEGVEPSQDYLSDFFKWLQHISNDMDSMHYPDAIWGHSLAELSSQQRLQLIEELYHELHDTEAACAATAIYRVMDQCKGIFRAEVDQLDLLLEDEVLNRLYDFMQYSEYTAFLDLVAHRKPNIKILEIGAGTGGTTNTVLPVLKSAYGERTYFSYTYTDISSGFFVQAKERFKEFAAVDYAILDISKDPIDQGFTAESFDLIIACNVSVHTYSSKTLLT